MLVQLYSSPPQKGRKTFEDIEAEERAENDDPDNEDWKDEIREIFARIDAQKAREAEDKAQDLLEPQPITNSRPDFGPRIRQL